METMSPVSIAIARKRGGKTRPSRGCCQRAKASTPFTRPVAISTMGM
jgi:hypothetical protein